MIPWTSTVAGGAEALSVAGAGGRDHGSGPTGLTDGLRTRQLDRLSLREDPRLRPFPRRPLGFRGDDLLFFDLFIRALLRADLAT